MCGIAVLISTKTEMPLAKIVASMCDLVEHRGPDDEGFVFFSQDFKTCIPTYRNQNASQTIHSPLPSHPNTDWNSCVGASFFSAMGHKRLSVLDLTSAGHQPMCTEDQSIWISYNGEVYNYREIRAELEREGSIFSTETDTEVIIKAYQKWGNASFSRFNGMFAFVICDRSKKKIIAVRDRFGVKPLYYWTSPNGIIAIASEIKQFSAVPGWTPRINGQCIYDFLNWGLLDHGAETCFKDVRQLRGGEYLSISTDAPLSDLKSEKWYTLNPSSFRGSYQDACHQFTELLTNSIQIRLRADVELGASLSGGLDSSSIVSIVEQLFQKKNITHKQKTFSSCSIFSRFDERKFIDLIVQTKEVKATYIYPELDQLLKESAALTWHQDEPTGSASIYAQWLLYKQIKEQKVKVLLGGQGADEQLAGYHGFFGNRFYELFWNLQWKRLYREMQACRQMHAASFPLFLLLSKILPNFLRQPVKKILREQSIQPYWLDLEKLEAIDREPFEYANQKSIQEQSRQQLLHTSLPMLLHWEDRNSMAHSVESRTPFLDYRIIEFSLGLPSAYKISEGWTKRVLRDSMKGVLPEEIRCRIDKMGFVTGEEEWVCKQHPEYFRKMLAQAIECSNGILRPSAMKILDEIVSGTRPFNHLPWRLISFGQWLNRFIHK
jgi:asparagine synthase (glutamine-hydrolysing)